ncbi:MAG: hypothetical protein M9894_19530 [Planctomycetes bacterium]|nr:hypothetical protein [Planctomycetota bacterium]
MPAPDEVRHLLTLGRRRWRGEGALDAAHEAFTRALALDPTCAEAWNDRGCLRAERGDLDLALRDLLEAIRLAPGLAEAQRNYRLLSALVGPGAPRAETAALSTVSGALVSGRGASLVEGLVRYLRAQVDVAPRDEERREDAIQEVVLRVLSLARSQDLPLAEALRRARARSTRGWVRALIAVGRRRRAAALEADVAAPSAATADEGGALRLDARLDAVRDEVLGRSQPATRWRRRLVWDVFVGGLVEGVRLRRAEVVAAVRALGVTRRRAGDGALLDDLDLIAAALRRAGGGAGG